MKSRRQFLAESGLLGSGLFSPLLLNATQSIMCETELGNENQADIVIIGGGMGGCAAALSACNMGATVILTEPTDWIGGQVSQQAVPPDEHVWIESFGSPSSYRKFRTNVRDYYRNHYPLTDKAKNKKNLNPGNGSVSRISHEPKVAVAVLESMLASAVSNGQLRIILNTAPVKASMEGDQICAVECLNGNNNRTVILHAKQFIDATEEGDLLKISKTEYVLGAESQKETGEPHAPEIANPEDIQALTYCFAMDHLEGEDHTIERPEMYDFWKNFVPEMTPPWSGKLLDWAYSSPKTLESKTLSFVPSPLTGKIPKTKTLNLFRYRRIIDRSNFTDGSHFKSDITCVNWPQNDYFLGNITDVSEEERSKNIYQAKQLSLSLLYWMQTEAPRLDGKQGWKGLRLRKDIVGTEDGLAKYPYIRESRRIKAELTIKEQDLTLAEREKVVRNKNERVLGKHYDDSVGIGYYSLDLHPTTGGKNYFDKHSTPFQIPLGAMIPVRVNNLIPACKNIGTTHITNGCYRLHPVEWSIGEAAGTLSAFAILKKTSPRSVRNSDKELQEFQSLLVKNGMELSWSKLS